METLAAIDIGSNAIRLVIGEMDQYGDIRTLKKIREPVRLGKDAFSLGEISPKTREKALQAFIKFREILQAHGVHYVKAVATAALRESRNRAAFVEDVLKTSGIQIDLIDGIEEGRLVYSAVAHRVDLSHKTALLIDIGGGSVELTIVDHGTMVSSQTFKLGTVRLLQILEDKHLKEKALPAVIEEIMAPAKAFLSKSTTGLHIDMAIGTGGNFECLGKLRVALLHKNSIFSMTRHELKQLASHLQTMTLKERVQYLRLREDRADVVVPAAFVTMAVMDAAHTDLLTIPYVGLRDGILADLGAKVVAAQQPG